MGVDLVPLVGGRCGACGRLGFPAADTCVYCGAAEVAPTPLSTTGTLWGWTSVTVAPAGYTGDLPYGFGVVELPEGIRLISILTEPDPGKLELGQPMRLCWTSPGEPHGWAFEPFEPSQPAEPSRGVHP
jgi:uncharacterized OB-fold protein